MNDVDIVLPWVNGQEKDWNEKKNRYLANANELQLKCAVDSRYRVGVNLKLWFTSIEKCMPWVNKIFIVTDGQIPDFLNLNNPKIKVVFHEDFIPAQYLPTFNSNTIEMNVFRIEELSENFILFNDDIFPLKYIRKEYFFKNELVCDEALERIVAPKIREKMVNCFEYCKINNMAVINKHFNKRSIQKKNFFKWYNLKYGKRVLRNICMSYFYDFDNFSNRHLANSFKKKTFKEIWEKEYEILDTASKNKFRNYSDVSQYLAQAWQICGGEFYPRKTLGQSFLISDTNYKKIINQIKRKRYPIICLNDSMEIKNYEEVMCEISQSIENIFPNKSSFEL